MVNRSYFKVNELKRVKIISEVLTLLPSVVVIISTKFQRHAFLHYSINLVIPDYLLCFA